MDCPACSIGTLVERPQLSSYVRDAYVCDRCKRTFSIPNQGGKALEWVSPVLSFITLGLIDIDLGDWGGGGA
jgi:hypothetical protein